MALRVAQDHSSAMAKDAAFIELELPSDQQARRALDSRYPGQGRNLRPLTHIHNLSNVMARSVDSED